jgi:hypothetical protein
MSVFTNSANSTPDEIRAYTPAILGLLGDRKPLQVLPKTEAALKRAVRGLTRAQLRKREAPGKWSIAHVLRHLADSEVVWGWRLRMILAEDRPVITSYDQDLWADRLGYGTADAEVSLREFGTLRAGNLRLLKAASPADLKRVGLHSQRGEESVEHLMKLYAGHDVLHLNQIARIKRTL